MLHAYDPAPRRPLTRSERWFTGAFCLLLVGLLIGELLSGGDSRKLSVVFIVLFWYPLIAIHELGHAACARFLGFRVHEIVLGVGMELWRAQLGQTRLIIRLLPAGGYVVPSPDRVEGARMRSALIYLAGPAAELLAALLTVYIVGPERIFSPSTALPLLAAQSFALAATMGALVNLVPSAVAGGASDGLGIWQSLLASDAVFAYQAVRPHLSTAQRHLDGQQPAAALATIDEALHARPEDPFLLAMRACCLAALHDEEGALEQLQSLRDRPAHSDLAEAERLHAAAQCALVLHGDDWLHDAEQACKGALDRVPDMPAYQVTYGIVLLRQQRLSSAHLLLQRAYKLTRDPDLEERCLQALAMAAAGLGLTEDAKRYQDACRRPPLA